jgi:hypothetical protein
MWLVDAPQWLTHVTLVELIILEIHLLHEPESGGYIYRVGGVSFCE